VACISATSGLGGGHNNYYTASLLTQLENCQHFEEYTAAGPPSARQWIATAWQVMWHVTATVVWPNGLLDNNGASWLVSLFNTHSCAMFKY
jgi:hypothetical protein